MDEFRDNLFSIGSNKSLRLDGMNSNFYKSYWRIVGSDQILMVQYFFVSGHLSRALNHTFISLIPETESTTRVKQFRATALCNVAFKVITKILATRLRPLLENIVAPNKLFSSPTNLLLITQL